MRLAMVLAFSIIAFPALADSKDRICRERGEAAEAAMHARLSGLPLRDALARVENSKSHPLVIKDMRNLLISAYKEPAYQSESAKRRAITEFANSALIECMETRPTR